MKTSALQMFAANEDWQKLRESDVLKLGDDDPACFLEDPLVVPMRVAVFQFGS